MDRCSRLLLFYGDQGLFAAFALFTGSLDSFSLCVRDAGADRQAIGNSTVYCLWMSSKVRLHPFKLFVSCSLSLVSCSPSVRSREKLNFLVIPHKFARLNTTTKLKRIIRVLRSVESWRVSRSSFDALFWEWIGDGMVSGAECLARQRSNPHHSTHCDDSA